MFFIPEDLTLLPGKNHAVLPVKSLNIVYKSCLKIKILTPLPKLPKNVGDLGKLVVDKGLKK